MSEAGGKPKQGRWGRIAASISRLSTAAWAAIAVALTLLAGALIVWTIFLVDPSHVPWRHAITWPRVAAVLILTAAIPPLVYWCVRLWLEGDPSRFPDIDYAWREGMTAIRRHGIALDSVPIFLVLGSSGEELERSIMQAAGLPMRVRGEPEGPAPIRWHASPEGLYLFCSEAGWLSAMNTVAARRQPRRRAPRPLPSRRSAPFAAPDPVPAPAAVQATPPPSAPAPASPAPVGGTIMLEHFVSGSQAPVAEARRPESAAAPRRDSGGTLLLNEPFTPTAPAQPQTPAYTTFEEPEYDRMEQFDPTSAAPAPVEPQDVVEQLQRLEYIGRLLRRERHPLCPVNGILTLLPFDALEGGLEDAQELQRAVKSDLAAAQRSLQIRCPVTALVIGMEHEPGFRELIRRVGRDRAAAQRFGRRFETRALASLEQMAALCVHVCGAFEDWIYTLFREEGAMARPGNMRLFGLLCKVRCNLQGPLMEALAGGFGYDPQTAMSDEPTLFSGCYFAATGATPDRQAFVRGVFDKLNEEQEDVEWTREALRGARRLRAFTVASLLLASLGVVSSLLMLGSHFAR